MEIKNFQIFPNNHKKKENEPDYRATAKIGDKFVDIGAGWRKENSTGRQYISLALSKPYQDRDGYCIVVEGSKAEKELEEQDNHVANISKEKDVFGLDQYPTDKIAPEDIPF